MGNNSVRTDVAGSRWTDVSLEKSAVKNGRRVGMPVHWKNLLRPIPPVLEQSAIHHRTTAVPSSYCAKDEGTKRPRGFPSRVPRLVLVHADGKDGFRFLRENERKRYFCSRISVADEHARRKVVLKSFSLLTESNDERSLTL